MTLEANAKIEEAMQLVKQNCSVQNIKYVLWETVALRVVHPLGVEEMMGSNLGSTRRHN